MYFLTILFSCAIDRVAGRSLTLSGHGHHLKGVVSEGPQTSQWNTH